MIRLIAIIMLVASPFAAYWGGGISALLCLFVGLILLTMPTD